ncbi:hypothetical protein [Geoalkalibacter halelectricus]|uniref:hypothetical protein n=1 Tax=Geoalkalibacter halelectricus TaxID=2847045 RepID=UPI003D1FDA3A
MPLEVFALIMMVIVFIVAIFLIPLLLQLRTTVQRIDDLVRDVQHDLVPMLKELREASEHVKRTTEAAEKGSELLSALGESAGAINQFSHFIKHDFGRLAGNLAGFWAGFRAAGKTLAKKADEQERR